MMAAQSETEQESFAKGLEELYVRFDAADPLQKARAKAWEQFQELGLPGARSEVFRYIRLKQLFSRSFQDSAPSLIDKGRIEQLIYPECHQSAFVFVNGCYRPELSYTQGIPNRVVSLPLNQAVRTYGTLLNNTWGKEIKEEVDPFAILNLALHREGLFLYIPPKTLLEAPLQILHIVDCGSTPTVMMPRVQLFAGTQAELKIVSTVAYANCLGCWVNGMWDIAMDEGARLQLTQVNEKAPDDLWLFDALRASLKRDCMMKAVLVAEGAAGIRNDYKVSLNGENGEAQLNGISMLKEKREAHVHVIMDHQAPNCRSMQLYKNVLNDFGHSSFEGKIMVRQPAQKTQAFQLNNNLLLSDRAHADSKPNLEIFADDVKASHGATVGQVDAEQLFYMKTRGFSEVDAKNLLVYGFCQEVIQMIPVASVLEDVSSRAKRVLTS